MTKSGRELTLVLRGRRLCADAAPELEMELKRNLDGVKRLVVDVGAVVYISSAGLRVFLSALHAMGEGGSATFRNVGEGVRGILEITGFDEMFAID